MAYRITVIQSHLMTHNTSSLVKIIKSGFGVSSFWLILLVLIGFYYTRTLPQFLDVDISDEAIYLSRFLGPDLSPSRYFVSPLF